MSTEMIIGKLENGISHEPVYGMAERIVQGWALSSNIKIADVGGGKGNFSLRLSELFDGPIDVFEHKAGLADSRLRWITMDLNEHFPVENNCYDACVSLEVIEHLENPRHFMRELFRILKPGGRLLISTPNQLCLSSKLSLLLRDHFQHFHGAWYPGHITALVTKDLEHIASECGFVDIDFIFTDNDRIPLTSVDYQTILPFLRGKWFSTNVGLIARKPG